MQLPPPPARRLNFAEAVDALAGRRAFFEERARHRYRLVRVAGGPVVRGQVDGAAAKVEARAGRAGVAGRADERDALVGPAAEFGRPRDQPAVVLPIAVRVEHAAADE